MNNDIPKGSRSGPALNGGSGNASNSAGTSARRHPAGSQNRRRHPGTHPYPKAPRHQSPQRQTNFITFSTANFTANPTALAPEGTADAGPASPSAHDTAAGAAAGTASPGETGKATASHSASRSVPPREQELIFAELILKHAAAPKGVASRAAAAFCISLVEGGRSLSELLPRLCASLDERDRAFVQEIVFGTLRQRRLLSATLTPLLNRSLSQKFSAVRGLLLCALYQLVYTRSPAHAVVSSSVAACTLCHCRPLSGMVNAVLRRFLREGGQLAHSEEPAVVWSFPDWLCGLLQELYPEHFKEILAKSNEHPPLWIRVENSKISTPDYLKLLQNADLDAEGSALSKSALRLLRPVPAAALPGFDSGLCTVQDLATQLAAPLLEPAPGEVVLDACAAPGGKSAHLLDLCPELKLYSADADARRLQLAEATFKRLKRRPVIVCCNLLETPENSESLPGTFDKILLDAPCSGTGVIRRHPDIKWLHRQKDLPGLCARQTALLDQAFARLKPGGLLLYTTCSILGAENQDQINSFLKRHPDSKLKPFTLGSHTGGMLQRLPGDDGGDGFFYARLIKTGPA